MEQPLEILYSIVVSILSLAIGVFVGWIWHAKSEAAAEDRHREIQGVTKQVIEDDGAMTRRMLLIHTRAMREIFREYVAAGYGLPEDLAAAQEDVEKVHDLIAGSITSKTTVGRPTLSTHPRSASDTTTPRREPDQ